MATVVREALVLEELGQHAGGGRDRRVGQRLAQDLGHPLLVVAVGVGVDEAHRDRLDLAPGEDPRDLARLVLVELGDHLAAVVDALGDLEPVAPPDVRLGVVLVGVPQVVARAAADLHHVAEAAACRPSPPSAACG